MRPAPNSSTNFWYLAYRATNKLHPPSKILLHLLFQQPCLTALSRRDTAAGATQRHTRRAGRGTDGGLGGAPVSWWREEECCSRTGPEPHLHSTLGSLRLYPEWHGIKEPEVWQRRQRHQDRCTTDTQFFAGPNIVPWGVLRHASPFQKVLMFTIIDDKCKCDRADWQSCPSSLVLPGSIWKESHPQGCAREVPSSFLKTGHAAALKWRLLPQHDPLKAQRHKTAVPSPLQEADRGRAQAIAIALSVHTKARADTA